MKVNTRKVNTEKEITAKEVTEKEITESKKFLAAKTPIPLRTSKQVLVAQLCQNFSRRTFGKTAQRLAKRVTMSSVARAIAT